MPYFTKIGERKPNNSQNLRFEAALGRLFFSAPRFDLLYTNQYIIVCKGTIKDAWRKSDQVPDIQTGVVG